MWRWAVVIRKGMRSIKVLTSAGHALIFLLYGGGFIFFMGRSCIPLWYICAMFYLLMAKDHRMDQDSRSWHTHYHWFSASPLYAIQAYILSYIYNGFLYDIICLLSSLTFNLWLLWLIIYWQHHRCSNSLFCVTRSYLVPPDQGDCWNTIGQLVHWILDSSSTLTWNSR